MSKQDLKWVIQRMLAANHSPILEAKKVRRACVAAILRWRPYLESPYKLSEQEMAAIHKSPTEFLNQPWVNDSHGEAELLFIQRALRPGDFWSGHVAFPGGKNEPTDTSNLDTVIRECKEEIGIDLGSPDFVSLGTLKHRTISLKKKRLTMVLIPHVFLQIIPQTPAFTIQPTEVAETHWISMRYLLTDPIVAYDPLADSPEMASPWPASVRVPAIPFPIAKNDKRAHLWGMTLRMAQETLGMALSPHTIMSAEEVEEFEKKAMNLSKL